MVEYVITNIQNALCTWLLEERIKILLEPRSLLVLQGSSRYELAHAIRMSKTNQTNQTNQTKSKQIKTNHTNPKTIKTHQTSKPKKIKTRNKSNHIIVVQYNYINDKHIIKAYIVAVLEDCIKILLEPRSLLVLQGSSRYEFAHAIRMSKLVALRDGSDCHLLML